MGVNALFSDAVGLALTSQHVSAVTARGWPLRLKDQHSVTCESVPGERSWNAAVSALRAVISRLENRSGHVAIALSNRFVRYIVAPWQDQLTNVDTQTAFARHCFREWYGAAADQWDVRVSAAPLGQPRIASAVDTDFLDAIRQEFARTRLKIRSIQPQLMAVFNKWRHKVDARASLFTVVEDQFYTCMLVVRGRCEAVHTGALNGALDEALPVILDREFMRSGLEERPSLFLYTADAVAGDPPVPDAWRAGVHELRDEAGIAASADPAYRTALLVL
jgi:hypothetical protein